MNILCTNLEKYNAIFCDVFNVSVDALDDDFCKEKCGWLGFDKAV